jgi:lactate dehydrogenase-like 2-hydroxyacid dehydrogenase
VDVNTATEHKIKVARIPGSMTGNAVSCAEMAIYLTLGVLRKQVYFTDTSSDNMQIGYAVHMFHVF